MERVNLYETLGVGQRDSAVAVRRAYRDLARLSHASTEVVPQFVREMEVAVAVLADRSRRAHYDDVMRGDTSQGAAEGGAGDQPRPREAHIDLLRDFEGGPPSRDEMWSLFRCHFAPGAEPKSARVQTLDLHLHIEQAEAPGSAVVEVLCLAVPLFHACAVCHGTGSVGWLACSGCDGSGVAEDRSLVRAPAGEGERVIALDDIGVRTPVLRLHIAALA